jgi:hypothetical protein
MAYSMTTHRSEGAPRIEADRREGRLASVEINWLSGIYLSLSPEEADAMGPLLSKAAAEARALDATDTVGRRLIVTERAGS